MPNMNIKLTHTMAKYVEAEVSNGNYSSANEVIIDALRALKDARDVQKEELRLLRKEVQLGIEAAERGEFSDRTLDEMYQTALREAGY